jgi:hypothetical protein
MLDLLIWESPTLGLYPYKNPMGFLSPTPPPPQWGFYPTQTSPWDFPSVVFHAKLKHGATMVESNHIKLDKKILLDGCKRF